MSKYLVFTQEILLPSAVVLVLLSLAWFTLFSSFFQITRVDCVQDFEPCENPALLSELEKLKSENIFTLSTVKIKQKLLAGDFMVRELEIHKQLPASLSFSLQSVYPVVALHVQDDSNWVIFDQKLRVIGSHPRDPNVPTVIVPGPLTLTVGKTIPSPDIVRSLQLAIRLRDELISFKTLTLVDDHTLELNLGGGVLAILTPENDESQQLHSLQAILADATIMAGVHVIDVRFSQPVIR